MSRYRLELANEADDADLRAVLAATPMPGRIALTFRREPSFFASIRQEAEFVQVIACRDLETGRVVGFGCRAVNTCYVNGEPTPVGYLSSLRLLKDHRSLGLIARGYKMLRELHEDGRTTFYLTTIADGNAVATKVLTSGRAGLPVYEPFGRYVTVAIPSQHNAPATGCTSPSVALRAGEIRRATTANVTSYSNFAAAVGRQRQFFPCGVPPMADLWFAYRNTAVTGCLGVWDQKDMRQTVVDGYTGWLGVLRPGYNAWARWRGRPPLPPPGGHINYLTATCPLVAGDDSAVFSDLLDAACGSIPSGSFLMLGLHERDPLLPVARRSAAAEYVTHLYLVHWGNRPRLDDRPSYLELGCL